LLQFLKQKLKFRFTTPLQRKYVT